MILVGSLALNICLMVGLPGYEPGMTGPESVVLPLHHSPITGRSCFAVAKIQRI